MMVARSPLVLAFALLAAGAALAPSSQAQGLVDRLRDVLGPPVEQGSPARQPRRQTQRAPAAEPSRTPETVPLPSARPGAPDDVTPVAETPPAVEADDATAPAGDDTDAAIASDGTADDTAEAVEPTDPPLPQPAPEHEAAPDGEEPADVAAEPATGASDDAAADGATQAAEPPEPDADTSASDDADTTDTAEPEPAPGPAYVSPEKARTVPEPGAPSVPDTEITPEEAAAAAAAIEDARVCEEELTRRGAEFTTGPSIADGACGVLRPVQLTRLSSGIAVTPSTQMLCRAALAFDIWASDGVEKAARDNLDGETVEAIEHASTYVCRDRASENGISEHGRGSAIDIAAFKLSGDRRIVVEDQTPQSPEDRFLADARRSACGPFATVLGPGTDADHATHLHLDIAARNNGSLYCR